MIDRLIDSGAPMFDQTLSATILRAGSSSNLLDQAGPSSPLSENQNLVDEMVRSSIGEATKGSALLAMLGAGAISRLTRAGVLSLAVGKEGTLITLLEKGGSHA